jgi:LysR family transcriptional regulator, transcriptional activator of nhaA
MERINYQHLYYFWTVAKHGSISAACKILHLAQPTISGQLSVFEEAVNAQLWRKEGRKLVLTDTGQALFHYAEEIFLLGQEMTNMLNGRATERGLRLNIGISDAMPKLIAYRLIAPLLNLSEPTQINCVEDKTERLLSDISLHSIDILFTDVPATPASASKVFNHLLGETAVGIFAAPHLAVRYQQDFPSCLKNAPFLLPTPNTALRRSVDQWFDQQHITPIIKAEVEDSALLKTFGAAGAGLFFSPSIVANEIHQQYGTPMLGLAEGVFEHFYAITAQRRLKHPLVTVMLEHAQQELFSLLNKSIA